MVNFVQTRRAFSVKITVLTATLIILGVGSRTKMYIMQVKMEKDCS